MNTNIEFSEEIIKILSDLFKQFGIIVNTNEDIVPYLKTLASKIVDYKESIAWIWVAIGIISIIIAVSWLYIAEKPIYESGWAYFHASLIIFGIIVSIGNAHTIITCRTFPEKVVIDYIMDSIEDVKYNSK